MVKTAAYLRTHSFRVAEHFRQNRDEGATATEYGLLVTFIAFGIVLAVTLFGDALEAFFGRLTAAVGAWNPAG